MGDVGSTSGLFKPAWILETGTNFPLGQLQAGPFKTSANSVM